MDRASPTARFRSPDGRSRGFAYGVLMVLAVIALLMGLAMAGMGAWLMLLGGSWYYLLAGVAIIVVAAVMLARRMSRGVSLFALVVAATLVWSLIEIHAPGVDAGLGTRSGRSSGSATRAARADGGCAGFSAPRPKRPADPCINGSRTDGVIGRRHGHDRGSRRTRGSAGGSDFCAGCASATNLDSR